MNKAPQKGALFKTINGINNNALYS